MRPSLVATQTAPVAPFHFARFFRGSIEARQQASMLQTISGACHCRRTRAAMVSPTASQLRRQRHAFVGCRALFSSHCAGRRPCSLWRCQHSPVLRPASSSALGYLVTSRAVNVFGLSTRINKLEEVCRELPHLQAFRPDAEIFSALSVRSLR